MLLSVSLCNYESVVEFGLCLVGLGVDPDSQVVSHHVAVVERSRWGENTCPICLCELFEPDSVVVALLACQHCLHLSCLNSLLSQQKKVRNSM